MGSGIGVAGRAVLECAADRVRCLALCPWRRWCVVCLVPEGRVKAVPPMGSGASPAGCSVPAAAAWRVCALTLARSVCAQLPDDIVAAATDRRMRVTGFLRVMIEIE